MHLINFWLAHFADRTRGEVSPPPLQAAMRHCSCYHLAHALQSEGNEEDDDEGDDEKWVAAREVMQPDRFAICHAPIGFAALCLPYPFLELLP